MAIRVTALEVLDIINTSVDAQVILNSMITTASLLVDEILTVVTPALTTARLKRIELYLAAHFVALTEEKGSLTGEDFGDAEVTLANVYTAGFNSTRFGQMALVLDTSGKLKEIGTSNLKSQFRVV